MRKKWTGFIIVFLLIINLSAAATLAYNRWLKPGPSLDKEDRTAGLPTLEDTLKLENSQTRHMGRCRMAFCQETDPLQQEIRDKRIRLLDEMKKDKPSLTEIDILIDDMIRLEGEVQKKAARRILEDKTILTPHQQERFLEMLEHHLIKGGGEYCLGEESR